MNRPTMKHIQYARDERNVLAERLSDLVDRVAALESSIGK